MIFSLEVHGSCKLIMIQLLLILELFFQEFLIVHCIADGEYTLSTLFDEDVHKDLEGRVDDKIDELSLIELEGKLVIKW